MAKCPYFRKCGGCSSQNIDYSEQVAAKRKVLETITDKNLAVFTGAEYGYRNRMDFIFHPGGLGFRRKGNWRKIVDVEECAISNDVLNTLLREVREFFTDIDVFDVRKTTGTFRYAVIRAPGQDSSISFVLNEDSMKNFYAVEKIKEFARITSAKNIVVTYVPHNRDVSISSEFFAVKGGEFLVDEYLGKKFFFSVQGFFQNNSEMAEKMHFYVRELLQKYPTSEAHLLDLYGGVGTFGIINSDLFKSVTVVESVKECIDAAKKNFQENSVKNIEAVLLDAVQLKKLTFPKPLYVINDPPRSGMHQKTIKQLNELKPEVIIYVSCNPKQLEKDLLHFPNYKIESAALFDFFPQTNHSEAVLELRHHSPVDPKKN